MKANYTLGPWKAIGDKIYSADKRQVAHVYPLVHPDNLNVMQSIPNAKLLAAAPELFEIVEAFLSHDIEANYKGAKRAKQLLNELKIESE